MYFLFQPFLDFYNVYNDYYKLQKENTFVSLGLKESYDTIPIRVDVKLVKNDLLDVGKFKSWRKEFKNAKFILENIEIPKEKLSLLRIIYLVLKLHP